MVVFCFEFSSELSSAGLEFGSHSERVFVADVRRVEFALAFEQEFVALHTFADDNML